MQPNITPMSNLSMIRLAHSSRCVVLEKERTLRNSTFTFEQYTLCLFSLQSYLRSILSSILLFILLSIIASATTIPIGLPGLYFDLL